MLRALSIAALLITTLAASAFALPVGKASAPLTYQEVLQLVKKASSTRPEAAHALMATLAELGSGEPPQPDGYRQAQLAQLAAQAQALLEIDGQGPSVRTPTDPNSVDLEAPLEILILKLPAQARGPLADQYLLIHARDDDPTMSPGGRAEQLLALRAQVLATTAAIAALPTSNRPVPEALACQIDESQSRGFLTLNTQPPSEIYWQGKKLGDTPLNRVSVPSGCLMIEAVRGEAHRTVQVQVAPNRVRIYQFALEASASK